MQHVAGILSVLVSRKETNMKELYDNGRNIKSVKDREVNKNSLGILQNPPKQINFILNPRWM